MRLLLPATSTLPDKMGGSERVLLGLARGLAARGHEVMILVPRRDRALSRSSTVDGVSIVRYDDPVHSFSTLYLPSLWLAERAIRRALSDWRPHIVHAHHGLSGLAATRAGAHTLAYTFYGPWHLEFLAEAKGRVEMSALKRWTRPIWAPTKARLARGIEGAALRRSQRIVALSTFSVRQLEEVHRVAGAHVVMIPGGVDLAHFAPTLTRRAARLALGLGEEGPLLFTVRRLVPRMGLELLLQALAALSGVRLVIGGAGWLRPRLEETARSLGVENRVRFAGFIKNEDLPTFYQAADLTVLPSVALEGFGLITLEALACGTPVVATPRNGTTDLLGPFEPSWIAEDSTPEAFARCVSGALARLPEEVQIRERCRAHAARYSWEKMVEAYEALYQGMLEGP